MTNLLPCPFCGGAPVMSTERERAGHGDTIFVAFIRCENCGAAARAADREFTGRQAEIERKALETAVERWNRRGK